MKVLYQYCPEQGNLLTGMKVEDAEWNIERNREILIEVFRVSEQEADELLKGEYIYPSKETKK